MMTDEKKDFKRGLTLNIEVRGEDNSIVKFKISLDTPMQKVFLNYFKQKNLSGSKIIGLKFMINDKIIHGADTAQTLMLKNGDVINVHKKMCFVQTQSEYVSLDVHFDDKETANFKILRTSLMEELFNSYAARLNVARDKLQFRVNGYEISGTDTPKSLKLKNHSIVDAYEKYKNQDIIQIKVYQEKHQKLKFKIRRSDSMQKIFDKYCSHLNLTMHDLRFMFDGQRINGRDTPRSLDIQDGDAIEVYQGLKGGKNY